MARGYKVTLWPPPISVCLNTVYPCVLQFLTKEEKTVAMPENTWNSALYDQKHAFVSAYGKGLVSLLDPQPRESILDLGCGTGHLAQAIAELGASVVGIDSSASMIASARAAHPHLEFLVADARTFSRASHFDAIFSNAALHWITEAEQVVQCIATSLKAGGRFVAEFGGKGCVAQIIQAVEQSLWEVAHVRENSGWYFPSIGQYATLLEQQGLSVTSAQLYERPTPLEDGEQGLRNWLEMFYGRVFRNMSEETKQEVLAKTEAQLRGRLFKEGQWIADYMRLRIVAYKPADVSIPAGKG